MAAPEKALEIKAAITAVFAFGTALFGWIGWLGVIWLCAMIMDYITGSCKALYSGTWSSSEARRGLWHKLGSIAAVLVAALCDIALGVIADKLALGIDAACIVTPAVLVWYIFTELGSIIENAAALGAPMPEFLIKMIEKVREAVEQRKNKDDKEKKNE